MPSFSLYKKVLNNSSSIGEAHKLESDMIMEATWENDIATRTAWFYDWYHDNSHTSLNDLPEDIENKAPMRIKYLSYSSQTFDKDTVSYHLQMKPSQECVVDYYGEYFKNVYGATYPCGLFCDIPDSKNKLNRWMVVAPAQGNDAQFPTYELLRCDYVLHVIIDGVKYNFPVVLRSQNSYNSGVWSDNTFTSTEDQQKFLIQINRITEKLYYGQRIIIDNNVLSEPRAWRITKVNRLSNKGCIVITCAQAEFNEVTDVMDDDGIWWADYNVNNITPEDYNPSQSVDYGVISYSSKPEIKIGGGYKKFTIDFFDSDDTQVDFKPGHWDYYLDDISVKNTLIEESTTSLEENQVKVKYIGNNDNIGKVIYLKYIADDGTITTTQVELTRL